MSKTTFMKEIFTHFQIPITHQQEGEFKKFINIFQQKNSVLNLSAIRDEENIIKKHLLDSLMLTKFWSPNGRIADVGTGGGFPGIPLKIFYGKDIDITFIDSVGKKIQAVKEFCEELSFENYQTIQGRGEELGKKEFAGYFDTIVTRAVAYLPDLLDYTLPLLKKGGRLIAYKLGNSQELSDAQSTLKKYNAKVEKIEGYELENQRRVLIFIKKV